VGSDHDGVFRTIDDVVWGAASCQIFCRCNMKGFRSNHALLEGFKSNAEVRKDDLSWETISGIVVITTRLISQVE
jgi:hypothetical protein